MGIKIKEPEFNYSSDSISFEEINDAVDKPKNINFKIEKTEDIDTDNDKLGPNDNYNPVSYWNERLNDLNKIKEVKINLPLPKKEIKDTNLFSFKENKNIKTKNIFNVSNIKHLGLNEKINNDNDEDLEIFLTTKPNSNDVNDEQSINL